MIFTGDTNQSGQKNSKLERLEGKHVAVVVFSHYPSDPRPRREAEALAQQGMKVEVISLSGSHNEPRREVFNGISILRMPLQRKRGGKFSYIFQYGLFTLTAFFLLAFRSFTRRYSLIHVHNMPDFLVFAALVPKICGAKVILDIHDPMPELMMTIYGLKPQSMSVRLLKWLEKWSIAFADSVLTVNLACKKIFSSRSCLAQKIKVVMNSPDEGIFKCQNSSQPTLPGNSSGKPFAIMYHGSLVERHGLDIAVAALGKVKHFIPQAKLRIYGQSTPFLEQVMNSVAGTELQNSIGYLGAKKLEEIVEGIKECDLGIIPNRRSIFTEINTPTRIFEYLSQGKPVIAPLVPGIRDYFGSEDLIYFELGNADDLAEKIKYVFFHSNDVEGIVKRGQQVYSSHKWSCERIHFVDTVTDLLVTDRHSELDQKEYNRRALKIAHDRRCSSLD